MKRKLWIISLAVALLIVAGLIYREPLVLRITGMRPFVEDRFDGWVAMGLNPDELDRVLRAIHDPRGTGPNSWVHELSLAAQAHQDAARKLEKEGSLQQAVREYKQAHILYYIARFPFVSSPEKL